MEYETKYKETKKNFKVPKNVKINKWILFILYIFCILIYSYFETPVLNPIYRSSYIFLVINILIFLYIIFLNKMDKGYVKKIFIFIIGVAIVFYLLISFISLPIVNSNKYYNLVGTVEQYNYEDEKDKLNTNLIPVVDYELAERLGDKVLGEDLGLGSQYEIGEYYLISTKEDIAWVAPLEPQNIFKWFQNKEGAPGYVYVSATNPNDVKLVQEINGEKIHLKYTNKSFFNNNIKRWVYLNNNFTKGLMDYSFEIDDEGNPYWVISTYKPTIGYLGYDVSGIIVVNAQTGEIQKYNSSDKSIPTWIDRIYPKELVARQLTYYGAYKNGWLNTITSQKEMVKPTDGISYMFIDGKPYFYTGMTSIKSDESTVGFILHSLTEKKTSFFKVNGATESAAKKSAQGKVQQYDYVALEPILLNIYEKPTYFMTLKDSDGLVKQYSFVSVENYNIVGIGSTVESTKNDYYEQLKNNNELVKEDTSDSEIEASGEIERIRMGDNSYYFKLKDQEELYVADRDISNKLVLTEPGDEVVIKYLTADSSEYNQVLSFENKTI